MATSSSCGLICVKSRNCANFVQLFHLEPSKQYKCIYNWILGWELTCKVFNHPSPPSYTDRHWGVIITPKTPREVGGGWVEIISPDYTDPDILNFRKKHFYNETSHGPLTPRLGGFVMGWQNQLKVQRKDQSVERNAYFYYFGQFCVFLIYFW